MAFLFYENLLTESLVDTDDRGGSEDVGYLFDGVTSTKGDWAAGADRWLEFDAGSSITVDTIAIAGHNFDGTETVYIQDSTDGLTWSAVDSFTPAAGNVHIELITSNSSRYWRIGSASITTGWWIGDLRFGQRLALPKGMAAGFTAPKYNPKSKVSSNITRGGALAGLSVLSDMHGCEFHLRNVAPSWFDSNWPAFIAHLPAPFYFMWDETNYPSDFMFAWVEGGYPVAPYNEHHLQSAKFPLQGFV